MFSLVCCSSQKRRTDSWKTTGSVLCWSKSLTSDPFYIFISAIVNINILTNFNDTKAFSEPYLSYYYWVCALLLQSMWLFAVVYNHPATATSKQFQTTVPTLWWLKNYSNMFLIWENKDNNLLVVIPPQWSGFSQLWICMMHSYNLLAVQFAF